jgi:hypothetical protein
VYLHVTAMSASPLHSSPDLLTVGRTVFTGRFHMKHHGPLYQPATARSCGIVSSREDESHYGRLRRHVVQVVQVSSKS